MYIVANKIFAHRLFPQYFSRLNPESTRVVLFLVLITAAVIFFTSFYNHHQLTKLWTNFKGTCRHTKTNKCHFYWCYMLQMSWSTSVLASATKRKQKVSICICTQEKLQLNSIIVIIHVMCTYNVDAANVNCLQASWNTVHASTTTIQNS